MNMSTETTLLPFNISHDSKYPAKKADNHKRRRKQKLVIAGALQSLLPFGNNILFLTFCCWFGTLGYAHYKLSLMETGEEEAVASDVFFATSRRLMSAAKVEFFEQRDAQGDLDDIQQEILNRNDHRFLIFEGDRLKGQGAGNLMNGLLAVHLLAEEYDRIVCVIPQYDFHMAFELIHPLHDKSCQKFFQENSEITLDQDRVNVVNFLAPPDECELQAALASQGRKALYVQANTYPRWRTVPPRYFFRFYRAKSELVSMLPYSIEHRPSTVVHLRLEDGPGDFRKGLDDESLEKLGAFLSFDTSSDDRPYLVTNHVAWFDYFEERFGWRHPEYDIVTHSAIRRKWGDRHDPRPGAGEYKDTQQERNAQKMQLWSDWFSIMLAKKVYHTHSDFSLSAIHWMGSDESNKWSRTFVGFDPNTKQLKLEKPQWLIDRTMKPLVDRNQEDGTLANCKKQQPDDRPDIRQSHLYLDTPSNTTQELIAQSLRADFDRMDQFRKRMSAQNYAHSGETRISPGEAADRVTAALAKYQQQHIDEYEQEAKQEQGPDRKVHL